MAKPTIDAMNVTYPGGQTWVTPGQRATLQVLVSDADSRDVPVEVRVTIDGVAGFGAVSIPFSDSVSVIAAAPNAQVKPDPDVLGRFDVIPQNDQDIIVTVTATDPAGAATTATQGIDVKPAPVPEPPPLALWPEASNTGYRGTLRPVGSQTVVAGATYTDLRIAGRVYANVAGATFRNCWLEQGIQVGTGGNTPVVVLEDCKIGGVSPGYNGSIVGNGGFVLRRCDISRSVDFVRIGDYAPATIEDCYLHDLRLDVSGAHNDGLQHYSGSKTNRSYVIRHNNFQCQGATTSGLFMADDWRGDVLIENNLFAGGNTGVRLHESGRYRVKGNRWVKGSFGAGGALNAAYHGPIDEWIDNAYTDGTAIGKPA